MAKRKLNKSAKIREAFAELGPDSKPAQIIEHLAKSKLSVSPQAVSQIKMKLGKAPKGRKGKPGRKPKADGLSLDDLLVAKKLVDSLGIENARKAIDALAKLA